MHLRFERFLEHLDYLQSNYQIISLADYARAKRKNLPLPLRSVVLTFDDGLRNFFTLVAPVLLQRGLPATAFIVTNKSADNNNTGLSDQWTPADDDRFLSWEEIKALAVKGIDIGSHTCSHPRLLSIPLEVAKRELEDSRAAIISQLERDGFPLSYAHGETSEAISRMAKSLGYSCAVTTTLGPNGPRADLFALRRAVVASDDDLPTFAARVSGLTGWLRRLARLCRVGGHRHPAEADLLSYEPLAAQKIDL